ncbi:MAG: DUF2877 domain-containing protein [Burkholderiales bacterium]
MQVVHIGERARAALARSGGVAAPLAAFAGSPYLAADGELVWVGARLPALHPRAVIVRDAPPRGVSLRFDSLPAHGWSPQLPTLERDARARVADAALALRGALPDGRKPGFPFDLARARIEALVAAYRRDDPDAVLAASIPLLGTGAGLTPSGDDLVGAALFGRRFLGPHNPAWESIAARLSREVAVRSHAVSAALFADLARGESFAPLHALTEALARGDHAAALAAARTLSDIGHSSGWDMLAGLFTGMSRNSCLAIPRAIDLGYDRRPYDDRNATLL